MIRFYGSVKHALHGITHLLRREKNFQIHFILFVVLMLCASFFSISRMEWISILICSALVFCLEASNSAIEKLADIVEPKYHEGIKKVKDMAAGAVLIAAVFSVVIALLIFVPKFIFLFNK